MIEYGEEAINEAMLSDRNFRRLYDKHRQLNEQVDEANAGDSSITDYQLEIMKKERLLLKDQLVGILEQRSLRQAVA